jgi:dihydroxyacid dehydratase/phosphogluconate dehydratase
VRDGDTIRLRIDTRALEGSADIIDPPPHALAARPPHPDLQRDSRVPSDTRLWAALQKASGGTWGGCVYDTDRIARLLETALAEAPHEGQRPFTQYTE